jgi:polyhydroxyalkanoate synthase subunit PhaC
MTPMRPGPMPAQPANRAPHGETRATNPARSNKTPASPALAESTVHEGSWWAHWARWVQARSGTVERLPATGDDVRGESPGPAPGRYVREK